MKKKDRKTLMAIDHVDLLLDLLCIKNEYNGIKDFRNQLINLTGKNLSVKSKTDQMYLHVLTALNLLENRRKQGYSVYERTSIADQLCTERKKPNKETYRSILQSVLQEGEYTKPFFERLLAILKKGMKEYMPILEDDSIITEQFSSETMRTLKALGKEAGLIDEREGYLIALELQSKNLDSKKFKAEVSQAYNGIIERQRRSGTYARITHAKISEVRRNVCALNNISFMQFNELFGKLLVSPNGQKIEIFGAAPQYLPEKDDPNFENFVFRHNGKIYVFMTM